MPSGGVVFISRDEASLVGLRDHAVPRVVGELPAGAVRVGDADQVARAVMLEAGRAAGRVGDTGEMAVVDEPGHQPQGVGYGDEAALYVVGVAGRVAVSVDNAGLKPLAIEAEPRAVPLSAREGSVDVSDQGRKVGGRAHKAPGVGLLKRHIVEQESLVVSAGVLETELRRRKDRHLDGAGYGREPRIALSGERLRNQISQCHGHTVRVAPRRTSQLKFQQVFARLQPKVDFRFQCASLPGRAVEVNVQAVAGEKVKEAIADHINGAISNVPV